ncbi:MAG: hypothetical protein ACI4DW_05335 [Lachnospiraceae bacterium]
MRREYSKIKALLCMVTLLLGVVITGCGKSDSAASGSEITGDLSRAQYIGLLGDSFGYNTSLSDSALFEDVSSADEYYEEIQAAAEWNIIESGAKFDPNGEATLKFAVESAVKAVGTDRIAASGAAIDVNNLADFYVNNIAQIDLGSGDGAVDYATAQQIIEYAKTYSNNLVRPQITEMELADGVKTAEAGLRLNADGVTGVIPEAAGYSVGDIVYIDATDTSIARTIKITEIDGESFSFEDASPTETYDYLNIRGTFQGTVVEAVSASDGTNVGLGQEIYDEMKSYNLATCEDGYVLTNLANSAKVDASGDHVVFTASFDVEKSATRDNIDTNAAANGQLKIGIENIKVDVDYESKWYNPLDPVEVSCKVNFDTVVSSEIHGSVSASIPLGEAYIQVWGPLNLKLMLTAHLGADGNVSISYTTENVLSIGWKEGSGLCKDFDSEASVDFNADATLTAEATLLADLRIGYKKVSYSLANAQVTTGAVAVAKLEADLLGEQPTCLDLQLYVPLKWGVNQSGCLLTDISGKLKYSATIWDSTSSPVQLHMHLEDWVRTEGDVCTRGEEVEQELTTPEGEPLEEIDPFTFEPIEFDFIELDSYVMYLGEGESMNIGFENIPDGYSQSDLTYEVLDPSVCSVSGGTVSAGQAGSTIVKISTSDGLFTVSLAVTVNEDYSIEGFQSL